MKQILITLLIFCCLAVNAQTKYEYPIDKETKKITYTYKASVPGSKHLLFKYAQQFVAVSAFDKELTSKTKHRNTYYHTKAIEKPITYLDDEQGKLFGNGYIDYHYRDKDRFVMTFAFRIYVKDNEYSFVLTDFLVKEFVDAGKEFGSNYKKQSSSSDARVQSFPLEQFKERSKYNFEMSEKEIADNLQKVKNMLHTAMLGKL
jgi:hypothetical protein